MKFKSALIVNFKLLREVTLEFSVDPSRPVTVIRAENGSGKTSTLSALQWGLFGDAGLDPSAREVRLSPSDWPEGKRCDIRAQIDFTHTVYDEVGGELVAKHTSYRILRTVSETPKGVKEFTREREQMHLFELTDAGNEVLKGAETRLAEMLPIEMKDVFFTDGDRAMNFVSPSLSKATKQRQVELAIRSLLGLTVLETANKHIQAATSKFTKQLVDASGSAEAVTIHTQWEEKKAELKKHRERLEDLDQQIEQIAKQEEEADRKLLQAMKDVGDPGELARKLEAARLQLKGVDESEQRLKKRHQNLLASESMSWELLRVKLTEGLAVLGNLADKGVIPATALPVLQDRLDSKLCICEADLSEGTEARKNVIKLLETQRMVDEEKKALTELYHRGGMVVKNRPMVAGVQTGWIGEYEDLAKDRLSSRKMRENLLNEIKTIEDKIGKIDQGAIEELKKARDAYKAGKSQKERDRQDVEILRRPCEAQEKELAEKVGQIKAANQKQQAFNNRITVSQDLGLVVKNTLDELQNVYMLRVSQRMNTLFLQMVGADPTVAGGVFKKAEITPDYEIKVLSADNRTLDPDHELNGASKRALTLAFIWALTEVSGVIAPRVIDTPLGMMSGGVKSRVVEIISNPNLIPFTGEGTDEQPSDRQEFQVILFLTRQEILMVEDLLDARAGQVKTLTNSASYPIDLLNDPKVEQPTILVCDCNHRQHCPVCARKDDDQHHLTGNTSAL